MEKTFKQVHEKYHQSTREVAQIVKEKNFTYRLLIDILQKYIKGNPSEILDIGCGAGTISFYLASKGNTVTGIDISQNAINACIKSANRLGLHNINFKRTEFPKKTSLNKKYDAIIFTEVIEHLPDDKLAIEVIYRLLKISGLLILSTPSINAPLHKLGLTKNFDEEVGHLRRYSLKQLIKLLGEAGFKIVATKKTEGILRNFLFVNPYAGKLVRYINFFGSDFVTFLDSVSLRLFGESNYIIVAKKK